MAEVMSIRTMQKMFPDEWIIAQVIEVDAEDVPVVGTVLMHSRDEDAIFEGLKAYLDAHPTERLYTFFTGDIIPEGLHLAFPFS